MVQSTRCGLAVVAAPGAQAPTRTAGSSSEPRRSRAMPHRPAGGPRPASTALSAARGATNAWVGIESMSATAPASRMSLPGRMFNVKKLSEHFALPQTSRTLLSVHEEAAFVLDKISRFAGNQRAVEGEWIPRPSHAECVRTV